MASMQTMQQRRASFALKAVIEAANAPKTNVSEYRSYAANFPAMIRINGLGQAAAFFKSKGDTHNQLYDLLSSWLTAKGQPYEGYRDLMKAIVTEDMASYRFAQAEAQAFLDWVTKFSKAYMVDNDKSGEA